MFYRTIKRFFLKKYIKKRLSQGLTDVNQDSIKTIGVLVDETVFFETEKLIQEFKKYSAGQFKINLLVYRKKPKKNEKVNHAYYTFSNVSFSGEIRKTEVDNFVNFPFDMLVSYYYFSNSDLELVTLKSKAKFKVGFENINNQLNHFFIKTQVEKYVEFTEVLFNYLKILKKI
jgi:hypothetical protein